MNKCLHRHSDKRMQGCQNIDNQTKNARLERQTGRYMWAHKRTRTKTNRRAQMHTCPRTHRTERTIHDHLLTYFVWHGVIHGQINVPSWSLKKQKEEIKLSRKYVQEREKNKDKSRDNRDWQIMRVYESKERGERSRHDDGELENVRGNRKEHEEIRGNAERVGWWEVGRVRRGETKGEGIGGREEKKREGVGKGGYVK